MKRARITVPFSVFDMKSTVKVIPLWDGAGTPPLNFIEMLFKGIKIMKKQITIGVGEAATTAKEFIDTWKLAERGEKVQEKNRLHFENLELLLKTFTPGRWTLLKRLHANGPMSIRALAKDLGRDYKNVHTDVQRLENIAQWEAIERCPGHHVDTVF